MMSAVGGEPLAPRLLARSPNWRPVVDVGVLSYSLYLWQNAFLIPD
jgi:peptidoglycan/LPS O-acetylase OafA/YrhL